MIRVCAWCRIFLGVKPPFSRWVVTHGICGLCQTMLGRSAADLPSRPRPRNILILSRQAPPVTAHLSLPGRAYLEPVLVLWDRRVRLSHADDPGIPKPDRRDRHTAGAVRMTHGFLFIE